MSGRRISPKQTSVVVVARFKDVYRPPFLPGTHENIAFQIIIQPL